MSFQELESKDQFQSVVQSPGDFIFIFVYDTEIPAAAKTGLAANIDQFPRAAPPYAFDISKAPQARDHLNIKTTPSLLVWKNGHEVTRVEEPNKEKMMDLGNFLRDFN